MTSGYTPSFYVHFRLNLLRLITGVGHTSSLYAQFEATLLCLVARLGYIPFFYLYLEADPFCMIVNLGCILSSHVCLGAYSPSLIASLGHILSFYTHFGADLSYLVSKLGHMFSFSRMFRSIKHSTWRLVSVKTLHLCITRLEIAVEENPHYLTNNLDKTLVEVFGFKFSFRGLEIKIIRVRWALELKKQDFSS